MSGDIGNARTIAAHPSGHDQRTMAWACDVLERGGSRADLAAASMLRQRLREAPRAGWARHAVFALGMVMLAFITGLIIAGIIDAIDWDTVLRFVAPTAFETRPIEEILEGASGRFHG